MNLSPENILSHAPDPGTAQRAKTVAHRQRWRTLEGNERAIWGTLGNPLDPYRTAVDFQGPAFYCSCPVRRKPCKHGVGLLLLFFRNNDAFQVVTDPPEWVADWLEKRDEKAAGRKQETPERSQAAAAALAEKRRENREKRLFAMEEGLSELDSWLRDLLRQGLASLEGHSDAYWTDLAARMTDAKLGGLARRIRQFPLLMRQEDWHEKMLEGLGGLYLIIKGFQHFSSLPEPLQDDLLNVSGVNFKKEEVLSGEGLEDHWLVAGQLETEEEGNLTARRTWFIGEDSGHTVLLLEFVWGDGHYDTQWKPGTVVKGEVVFYPSAFPQRILFTRHENVEQPFDLRNGYPHLEAFAAGYAKALGRLPWLSLFPAVLKKVVPVFQNDTFVLVDEKRRQVPLLADENLGWKMVAISGGRPVHVFGTWNGSSFQPLSAVVNGTFQCF